MTLNIPVSAIRRNVIENSRKKIHWLNQSEHGVFKGKVAIVGGSPSMKNKIEELRQLQKQGVMIWSLNGTHDYLIDKEIIPDFFAMVDARPCNDFCNKPQKSCFYLLASQCNPKVFDKLKGYHRLLWHSDLDEQTDEIINKQAQKKRIWEWHKVGSRKTIGLTSIFLAYTLGFREFMLYGMDSSFNEYQHSYKQEQNEGDTKMEVLTTNGKTFITTPVLAAQACLYQEVKDLVEGQGGKVIMCSEGLIKEIHNGNSITTERADNES